MVFSYVALFFEQKNPAGCRKYFFPAPQPMWKVSTGLRHVLHLRLDIPSFQPQLWGLSGQGR
jgi:hypothetical protein